MLTVEGGTVPGPSGEEAAQHLRRNGIKAKALTVKPGDRTTGEIMLDHAASLGCDLLVKGAYTQSRLRQMIFGGATRHILANATLPVLDGALNELSGPHAGSHALSNAPDQTGSPRGRREYRSRLS